MASGRLSGRQLAGRPVPAAAGRFAGLSSRGSTGGLDAPWQRRRDRKPGGERLGGCGRTWLLDPTGGEAISRGAARRRARSGQDGPGAWRVERGGLQGLWRRHRGVSTAAGVRRRHSATRPVPPDSQTRHGPAPGSLPPPSKPTGRRAQSAAGSPPGVQVAHQP